MKAAEEAKAELKAKKEAEEKRQRELAELFTPVLAPQKVPFGTDPKTVLCLHFKAGACNKGNKCKFSHDLQIERKVAKRDLYTDSRDTDKEADSMDTWDQSKLESVVLSKHGNPKTTTDIVCKFFLEAIENEKYGWFWDCPNGGKICKYRHALPPGFVLKSKKTVEVKQEITIEEFLETERHKLGTGLTPVTLDSFNEWKRKRMAKQEAEASELRKSREAAFKAGKNLQLSGRELFDYNPSLAMDADGWEDDEDAFDVDQYRAPEPPTEQVESLTIDDTSNVTRLDVQDS
ncbi:Translation machinery-associated protein 46 [Entomophthora muscae]|uniref:Translation machinery-associated protein 46 n=1 Tax=Entomophthora muscae TaxID=34485 RepID=A0ACC2TD60_9FUNG|nr:Translation machinery-associated protein 46 [Entomophthora muscae]